MATTTNFGWETPDDTDLVKDGAAAIRTLGQSIDTSMADLEGGTTGQVLSKASNADMDFTWVAQDDSNAIQNAIVDAKGDLIAASAADTPARLAVGTNGQVLTADSTAATGLAWSTISSGGMTLINTGGTTLTGSAITVGSIPDTYKHLYVVVTGVYLATAGNVSMRINSDTGNNYTYNQIVKDDASVGGGYNNSFNSMPGFRGCPNTASAPENLANAQMWIPNYTSTAQVSIYTNAGGRIGTTNAGVSTMVQTATYNTAAAISSITLTPDYNFSGGTIYVYGVK